MLVSAVRSLRVLDEVLGLVTGQRSVLAQKRYRVADATDIFCMVLPSSVTGTRLGQGPGCKHKVIGDKKFAVEPDSWACHEIRGVTSNPRESQKRTRVQQRRLQIREVQRNGGQCIAVHPGGHCHLYRAAGTITQAWAPEPHSCKNLRRRKP